MKQYVFFLRRLGKPNRVLGSAYLRGDQLVSLLRPHLEDRITLRVQPFHAGLMPYAAMKALSWTVPRQSVFIVVKSAARGLTRKHLEPLRQRGAIIGFDCVDMPISDIDFDLFDFVIAASIAGQRAIKDWLQTSGQQDVPVKLLHHHADQRLYEGKKPDHQTFRCGYVGMPENVLIPERLDSKVQMIPVKYSSDFGNALPRIRDLSCHYAVRPDVQEPMSTGRAFKPFTKGFTAAACGANILVNRSIDDAADLLGDDYPYLVNSTDGSEVERVYTRAQDDFGGPTWRDAIERMHGLWNTVAPTTLADNMSEIIDQVSAHRNSF